MSLRVCIVEDDLGTRRFLAALIGGSPGFTVTGAHATATGALAALAAEAPDVILLDLELPGCSGQECITKFGDLRPAMEILVLTIHDEADWLFPALEAGASGYLVKPPVPAELLDALQKVHAGGSMMSAAIARRVLEKLRKPAAAKTPPPQLTHAEEAVLALVAGGLCNKEIGGQLGMSDRTVETHLAHARAKLAARNRAEAAAKWTHGRA